LADWAGVVADLVRQLDHNIPDEGRYCDAARRTPGAVLRRYLGIRDRSCVMIGCRAPAHTTDKDHTIDHTHVGPTLAPNLGEPNRAPAPGGSPRWDRCVPRVALPPGLACGSPCGRPAGCHALPTWPGRSSSCGYPGSQPARRGHGR
jgi:hypothetical protein